MLVIKRGKKFKDEKVVKQVKKYMGEVVVRMTKIKNTDNVRWFIFKKPIEKAYLSDKREKIKAEIFIIVRRHENRGVKQIGSYT